MRSWRSSSWRHRSRSRSSARTRWPIRRAPSRRWSTRCPPIPAGDELLHNLERLAEATGDWKRLLDVYAQVARARTETEERVELLRLRAEVREKRMGDPSAALDETLRSFAIEPRNAKTQEEVLRLARVTGRSGRGDQGSGAAVRAGRRAAREAGRRARRGTPGRARGQGLPVRAFRAYLNAFRLAPDDEEIVEHLWRLATRIGRYHDKELPAPTDARAGRGRQRERRLGGRLGDGRRRGE